MTHRLELLSRSALALGAVLISTACVLEDADVAADATIDDLSSGWSAAYTQNRNVSVVPPAGWTVDRVEYSVEDEPWILAAKVGPDPAKPGGSVYTIALTNLDIGDNQIVVRVQSSYRGETKIDAHSGTIKGIVPVFSCAATSAATTMLPSPNMIRENGTEVRTLIGYFGDPAQHTVTFEIAYVDEQENEFTSVGSVVNQGRTSVTAEFDVSNASCFTGPGPGPANRYDCDVPYTLNVRVDGVEVPGSGCPAGDFGQIHSYWDS